MQLEKEKKEKRERERCRALAQRIAEEANPASAALLGEQMPLLAKALHSARKSRYISASPKSTRKPASRFYCPIPPFRFTGWMNRGITAMTIRAILRYLLHSQTTASQ